MVGCRNQFVASEHARSPQDLLQGLGIFGSCRKLVSPIMSLQDRQPTFSDSFSALGSQQAKAVTPGPIDLSPPPAACSSPTGSPTSSPASPGSSPRERAEHPTNDLISIISAELYTKAAQKVLKGQEENLNISTDMLEGVHRQQVESELQKSVEDDENVRGILGAIEEEIKEVDASINAGVPVRAVQNSTLVFFKGSIGAGDLVGKLIFKVFIFCQRKINPTSLLVT